MPRVLGLINQEEKISPEARSNKILKEIDELTPYQNTPTKFMPKILLGNYTNEAIAFFANNNEPKSIHPYCTLISKSVLESKQIKEMKSQSKWLIATSIATFLSALGACTAALISYLSVIQK